VLRRRRAALGLALLAAVGGVTPGVASADDDDDVGQALATATVPGELLVEVDRPSTIAAVVKRVGSTEPPEALHPGSLVFRVFVDPALDQRRLVDAVRDVSGVLHAQANPIATIAEFTGGKRYAWADVGPADPTRPASAYIVAQIALGNSGLPALSPAAGSPIVAVLDTGIDAAHPALAGRIHPGGVDVVDGDLDPSEVADGVDNGGDGLVDEAFGHGTYVAGLIALVAPSARLLPVRVLDSDGSGSAWTIAQGLVAAADRGAGLVNMSLGAGDLGFVVEGLVKDLVEGDIVIVAAAGNDGDATRRWPAAYPDVISVGGHDGRTGIRSTFTNWASWVQLSAPGVGIDSTYPGGRYARWGGTSAAAPVVTAAAALIRQIAPRMPADDVAGILYSKARQGGTFAGLGHGGLDVAAALAEASTKARDFGG
jgi:subtilisin family serine protease